MNHERQVVPYLMSYHREGNKKFIYICYSSSNITIIVTMAEHLLHDPKTTISSSPYARWTHFEEIINKKNLCFILYKWEGWTERPSFGQGSLHQAGASSGGPIRELTAMTLEAGRLPKFPHFFHLPCPKINHSSHQDILVSSSWLLPCSRSSEYVFRFGLITSQIHARMDL